MRIGIRTARALVLALAVGTGCSPVLADPVEEFYRGKTISLVVSTPPGGGYDIYARLLARHYGRHIPGNPNIIVQNMVGAGGLRATTTLYNVSARDGTVIGIVHSTAPFVPLLDSSAPKFDARRFGWIGSMTRESSFCVIWGEAPVKSFKDALTTKVIVGSTGPGSHMEVYPVMMNRLFGTRFEVVSGYAGGNDIYLAMERREVEGRCGVTIPGVRNTRPEWIAGRKVNFIIQTGLEPGTDEVLRGVPMLLDMAKTDEQRKIMELMFANGEIQIPVLTPPDVPAARLAALRASFNATMRDPALLHEAKKQHIESRYVPGEDVEKLIKRIYALPQSIIDAAIAATRTAGTK